MTHRIVWTALACLPIPCLLYDKYGFQLKVRRSFILQKPNKNYSFFHKFTILVWSSCTWVGTNVSFFPPGKLYSLKMLRKSEITPISIGFWYKKSSLKTENIEEFQKAMHRNLKNTFRARAREFFYDFFFLYWTLQNIVKQISIITMNQVKIATPHFPFTRPIDFQN